MGRERGRGMKTEHPTSNIQLSTFKEEEHRTSKEGRLGGEGLGGKEKTRANEFAHATHGSGAGLSGVKLKDLGPHRLRDLREPEHIFQVVAPGLGGSLGRFGRWRCCRTICRCSSRVLWGGRLRWGW